MLFQQYWDDYTVFIFPFAYVVYHIDWFADNEPSLYLWDKSYPEFIVNDSTAYIK